MLLTLPTKTYVWAISPCQCCLQEMFQELRTPGQTTTHPLACQRVEQAILLASRGKTRVRRQLWLRSAYKHNTAMQVSCV